MSRKLLTITIILTAILASIVSTFGVEIANANPIHLGELPPDDYTNPPSITIISPENNSYYNSSICLSLKVSEGESTSALSAKLKTICYKADWLTANVTLYSLNVTNMVPNIHEYSTELNLTDIPEGNHSIIVYAVETGTYDGRGLLEYYTFTTQNSAFATFTVNASANPTPPVPEFSWLMILPLVLFSLLLGLLVKRRKL